jgi:hypothetical protein
VAPTKGRYPAKTGFILWYCQGGTRAEMLESQQGWSPDAAASWSFPWSPVQKASQP